MRASTGRAAEFGQLAESLRGALARLPVRIVGQADANPPYGVGLGTKVGSRGEGPSVATAD